MFRRLGTLFAAIALFTVAGGHWAVLQSVAWAQMLRDYSVGASLTAAVEKTFSGKFPCGMCRKIAEAKKDEAQKRPALLSEKKSSDFLAATPAALPAPRLSLRAYPAFRPNDPGSITPEPAVPVPIA